MMNLKFLKHTLLLLCLAICSSALFAQDSTSVNKPRFQKNLFLSVGGGFAGFYNSNLWDLTIRQGDFLDFPIHESLDHTRSNSYTINPRGQMPTALLKNAAPTISTGIEVFKVNDRKIKFSHSIEASLTHINSSINYSTTYREWSGGPMGDFVDTNTITTKHFIASLGYCLQTSYKRTFLTIGLFASFIHLNVYRHTVEWSRSINPDGTNTWSGWSKDILEPPYYKYNYLNGFARVSLGRIIQLNNFSLKPAINYSYNPFDGYNLYSLSLGATYKLKSKTPSPNSKKKEKLKANFYAALGGGVANFYNSKFLDYTIYNTPITQIDPYLYPTEPTTKETRSYISNNTPVANFGCGVEFRRNKSKTFLINQAIELNYNGFASKLDFVRSSFYPKYKNFIDSCTFTNKHTIISLGYKIQPTYKNVFVSVGAYVSYEYIACETQTRQIVWPYNSSLGTHGTPTTYQFSLSTSQGLIKELLQVSVGRNIQLNQFCLKPALNLISNPYDGVNMYTVSLGVLLKSQHKEEAQ